MITLLTRKELVETKKIIDSELTKMQKAFYDEDILNFHKEDKEEHLYLEQFDLLNRPIIEYTTYNKIIGIDHSDINTFTAELIKKLAELFKKIGATEFFVISHLKLDFLGNRKNPFPPLVNSYTKLEMIAGEKTYKEAFRIDKNNLPEFIEILFWISRCDPSAAEFIYLFDANEKIQINICKHGNLHLTEFGNEQLTIEVLKSLGWIIIDGPEFDGFTIDYINQNE